MERRFVVYTEPHAQDPSWLNPVIEVQQNPSNGSWEVTKPYVDASELTTVAKEIVDRQAYAAAFNQGAANVMALFGHSPEEYYKAAKERKEKANAKTAVTVPAPTTAVPAKPASAGENVGPVEGQ